MKNKDKKAVEPRETASVDINAARNKAAMVTELLKARYPDAVCSLEWHDSAWKLLVMPTNEELMIARNVLSVLGSK